MAYEDTKCPCGGKKPTDTMLCDDCNTAFKGRHEWEAYQDTSFALEYRRNAAIILVTLSRARKREMATLSKKIPEVI